MSRRYDYDVADRPAPSRYPVSAGRIWTTTARAADQCAPRVRDGSNAIEPPAVERQLSRGGPHRSQRQHHALRARRGGQPGRRSSTRTAPRRHSHSTPAETVSAGPIPTERRGQHLRLRWIAWCGATSPRGRGRERHDDRVLHLRRPRPRDSASNDRHTVEWRYDAPGRVVRQVQDGRAVHRPTTNAGAGPRSAIRPATGSTSSTTPRSCVASGPTRRGDRARPDGSPALPGPAAR